MRVSATDVPSHGDSPHPSIFLLLNLPFGITSRYIVVVVPFLVTRAGLPVLTAASIVAIGLAPKASKILWAPLADIGLTLKKWYVIGAAVAGGMLVVQGWVPLTRGTIPFVAAALFAAECGSSLLAPSLGGLMAEAMPENLKGLAAGWYQLGGKVGRGAGGGIGLWLAAHTATPAASGLVLGLACIACIMGLRFLREPQRHFSANLLARFTEIGRELWQLIKSREGLLVAALALSPIGISGVDNFWSGVAVEWKVSASTVVLVTGFASAAISCVGCLLAGWWADRADRRVVYLATGGFVAAAGIALAAAPHVPGVFVAGTLAQKFSIGMSDAALSALILGVIGRSAAATKYTVLAALGNIGELYMTVASGWIHDRWNTAMMLSVESVSALVCISVAAVLLKRFTETAQPQKQQFAGGE
jgi:MFS transporter, PAT family, beta-lactamase induction signal transducer AmpG